jgi:hypothetical protein
MKTLRASIALTGLLVGGFTGLATAANTIEYVHISGAPAYRQDSIAVLSAVVASFPGAGETGAYNKVLNPSTGAVDPTNASAEQWYIPNFSSNTDLVISLSLTGSAAGVESVSSGSTSLEQNFIPDADSTASLIGSPNNTGSLPLNEQHVPDFTLSDTFQATTPYNGTVTVLQKPSTTVVHNTYTFGALNSTQVAIEPYVWVGTPGLATRGVTNITTAQAQNLYQYGKLPLSFFTGKSADSTSYVYALTRDPGSGSRLIAAAETGVGVTTLLKTYEPTVTGATADNLGNFVKGTISGSIPLYPAGVIKSTQIYDPTAGDTGYPSFGTADQTGLLAAITSTPTVNSSSPSTAQFFIAYFNPTDGAEAVAAGSEQLTYNGVTYSQANLQNGLYTFWSYEQIQAPSTLSSQASTILNDLVNAWPNATLSTGVQLTGVNVSRSVDGGTITAQ